MTTLFAALLAGCGASDDSAGDVALAADAELRVPADTVVDSTAAADRTDARPARPESPAIVRGIYLNAYSAGSSARLAALLRMADRTELNAFVIDVKDERGIHYPSDVELARELAQPGELTIGALSALVDTLHAHDVRAIARIVVFKDPILSKAKPDWSIRRPDGELWMDKAGNTWVSAWDPEVWDYNLDIAEEAVRAGFDEIQFDYVRFPEPYPSLPEQVHAHAAGTRTEAIVAFLNEARKRLHPLGATVAADVFGLSPNDALDINIGQQWEDILAASDHILPMVYPSHYLPTHLRGVSEPNRMPYETVSKSLGVGMIRVERLRAAGVETATVIPWLQAFSAPWVDPDFEYGAEQAEAQIQAVYDVGLEGWIFWHPGSRYEHIESAFAATTESRAQPYEPDGAMIEWTDAVDRVGARAARQRVVAADDTTSRPMSGSNR